MRIYVFCMVLLFCGIGMYQGLRGNSSASWNCAIIARIYIAALFVHSEIREIAMRLPRKKKKQVKKIVAVKTALKVTMSAMTGAMGMVQLAIITSRPIPNFIPNHLAIAEKTLAATRVTMDTAQAVQKIMSEPPNSWRDFIRK